MSHAVILHHVGLVPVADDEREAVMLAIASANQFVSDNYEVDDERTAYFAPCGSDVLVPIRTDIVGNLLVYIETAQLRVPNFLVHLGGVLRDNGIRISDCARMGGHRAA